MIYNLEKIDRVINKIITDLGLSQEIPYSDFIEWMADALEHIGSYYQFEERECNVLIQNYQGLLPCDLYKVIRMLNGCSVSAPSGFYGGSFMATLEKLGVDFSTLSDYEKNSLYTGIGLAQSSNVVETTVTGLSHNKNLFGDVTANAFTSSDYNINFNRITTAFETGIIRLQYLALPVDERGWPLVPDNVSFRDALFWKVAYHLSMRDPSLLKNPRMQDMEYCKDKWDYYCVQARAAANMPDREGMERIKNIWLSLVPDVSPERNLYRTMGKGRHNLDGRN
jgi:hypothetical protein